MTADPRLVDESRRALWLRRLKLVAHQTHRLTRWVREPGEFPAPSTESGAVTFSHLLHAARIPLTRTDPDAEPRFELGKRHNVALAAPAFDGLVLTSARPFSWWRILGRVTEAKGYRMGMELRGGCIVPAIGGGLCLLSRALFQAAVYADCQVLERHGHSLQAVPTPPGVLFGLDATVLWPHVDLRFAPREGAMKLMVKVKDGALLVNLRSTTPRRAVVTVEGIDDRVKQQADGAIRENRVVRHGAHGVEVVAVNRTRVLSVERQHSSCLSCGEVQCHARVAA